MLSLETDAEQVDLYSMIQIEIRNMESILVSPAAATGIQSAKAIEVSTPRRQLHFTFNDKELSPLMGDAEGGDRSGGRRP